MKMIIIDTTNVSRDDVKILMDILDNDDWEYSKEINGNKSSINVNIGIGINYYPTDDDVSILVEYLKENYWLFTIKK